MFRILLETAKEHLSCNLTLRIMLVVWIRSNAHMGAKHMTKRGSAQTSGKGDRRKPKKPPASSKRKRKLQLNREDRPTAAKGKSACGRPSPKKSPKPASEPEQARFPVPAWALSAEVPPKPSARVTLTLRFDPELLDRARNACHANDKTFQQMFDYALWNMTYALEDRNGGKPYPPRPGKLKTGPKPKKPKGK